MNPQAGICLKGGQIKGIDYSSYYKHFAPPALGAGPIDSKHFTVHNRQLFMRSQVLTGT
jgi:hypothetical protein